MHVSPPERAALRALLTIGLADCFRLFEQPEKTYSWWDYRMMAFRRNARAPYRPDPGERRDGAKSVSRVTSTSRRAR